MPLRSYRADDYKVGWISALPIELNAALQVLDEQHEPIPSVSTNVSYILGRIAGYCVVIAWLPAGEYGTSSAAAVASDMTSKFSSLKFCLLVGIGGGVPSQDVRLGDIVVSQPKDNNGGVIQYDLGSNTESGFVRKGFLNAPPRFLRSLLSHYQARNLGPTRLSLTSHLLETNNTIPNPRPEGHLYRADYPHQGGETCEGCDKEFLIHQSPRATAVHYGTIASGNQVIKNAALRDTVSKELGGVLCFEMEAAGIMNTLPCLVIRGICDYADSHKNKQWQPHAALTAAVYAKDLLWFSMQDRQPGSETRSQALVLKSRTVHQAEAGLQINQTLAKYYEQDQEPWMFLIQRISSYKPAEELQQHLRQRCPGTAEWIFEHEKFISWQSNGGCLWLEGKIGSGKSIITSSVIERLSKPETPLVHYFFNRSNSQSDMQTFVTSIVQQLLLHMQNQNIICPSHIEHSVRQTYGNGSPPQSGREFRDNIIGPLLKLLHGTTIITDGADERSDECLDIFFEVIEKSSDAKIFISGRDTLQILTRIKDSTSIHITEESSRKDIKAYVKWRIERNMRRRPITEDPNLLQTIHTTLEQKAERMMLWVNLQIECLWRDCFNDEEIIQSLDDLPKDLDETYTRCLEKIETSPDPYARSYAFRVLSWTLTARRSLTLMEMQDALAIDETTWCLNPKHKPTIQAMISSCANLIIVDDDIPIEAEDSYTIQFTNSIHARVLPVHHSLLKFLEIPNDHALVKKIQQVLREPADGLASLCVRHLLSEDYSLSVQRSQKVPMTLPIPIPGFNLGIIGGIIKPFTKVNKPINVSVQLQPTNPAQSRISPAIFHYARDQWPVMTEDLSEDDSCWKEFERLVQRPNLSYRLHPWALLGQSLESHFTALLAWSIQNSHFAMRDIAFERKPSVESIQVPIPQYGGYNCVILAVRANDTTSLGRMHKSHKSVVERILLAKDERGWDSIYHAAETGASGSIMFILTYSGHHYHFQDELRPQTALEVATTSQEPDSVQALLSYIWNNKVFPGGPDRGPRPRSLREIGRCRNIAIENGYCAIVKSIDEILNKDRAMDMDIIKTADHNDLINHFMYGSAEAMSKAMESGHVDVLLHVAQSGNYLSESAIDLLVYACKNHLGFILTAVVYESLSRNTNQPFPKLEEAYETKLFNRWMKMLEDLKRNPTHIDIVLRIEAIAEDIEVAQRLCPSPAQFRRVHLHGSASTIPRQSKKPETKVVEKSQRKPSSQQSTNVKTKVGKPEDLLAKAIARSDLDAMIELVNNGADVNSIGPTGESLIHTAVSVSQDNLESLFYLLTLPDIKIDLQNATGDTALHLAVELYRLDIVKLLVRHGSDITMLINRGLSAVDLAQARPSGKIRTILTNAWLDMDGEPGPSRSTA